jgi:hypothetical protein
VIVANPQPMMAATRDALNALREPRRAELAFLYSTPAYRRQLEYFGLGEVGEALTDMARRSEWKDLGAHLCDEVMDHIVPQGTFDEIPVILDEWYSGVCDGLSLPVPPDDRYDSYLADLVQRCKAIPTSKESAQFT